MTQPKFAPIGIEDEVRPSYKLDVPRPWSPHRPGEFDAHAPRTVTSSGPDQGYLDLLAQRFVDKIVLGVGEYLDDVLAGATAIGVARASFYGRAPVIKDLTFALGSLGYLTPASDELHERRAALVGGVAHDLWKRSQLVAQFTDAMFAMTPETASSGELWRTMSEG